MQDLFDNIIQFKSTYGQTLFKNAKLLDLDTGKISDVDIVVEKMKIVAIDPVGSHEKFEGKVEDLGGRLVIPPFVNAFCDSQKALEKRYGRELIKQESLISLNTFMMIKNLLAGAGVSNDVSILQNREEVIKGVTLENVDQLSEKELSELSDSTAKNENLLFMKIGQNLDELGSVDKIYHKPISQVLEDFGFLDRKPVIVGGNCLEKDELQLFRQYDCNFILTPFEDGQFGRRPTNVMTLKSLDYNIGLGSGYSFDIDFFAMMRQILMSQRGLFEDEDCLTEQEVLKMATSGGCKALGMQKDLKIEVGGNASFIVLDTPVSLYSDIFKKIVWELSNQNVSMAVLGGRILKKDGEITFNETFNYDIMAMQMYIATRRIKDDN